MVYLAERNLDNFYIFDLDELHDVSKRGLAEHGNDTRAVVKYIVDDLHKTHGAHINLQEDWVFNNAGGAMGAMYIIHASEYTCVRTKCRWPRLTNDKALRNISLFLVPRFPHPGEGEDQDAG